MPESESALVDLIYAAAADGAAWGTVLQEAATFVGARAGSIQTQDPLKEESQSDPHVFWNLDEERAFAGAALMNQGLAVNPVSGAMARSLGGDLGRVSAALRSVGADDLRGTWFWDDYMAGLGLGDIAGLALDTPAGGAWSVITLFSGRRDGAFDDGQLARFQLLAPHLRRSARIRRRVAEAARLDPGAAQALELAPTACVLLDAAGRVLIANAAARRLASSGDGLRLTANGLELGDSQANQGLARAVFHALRPGVGAPRRGAEVLAHDAAGDPLLLVVTPLGGGNPFGADYSPARVAIYLVASGRQTASASGRRRLKLLFNLSDAEAEVAADLVLGAAPDEIAQARGRSIHTVRVQIRAVLEKADLSGIGQLARFRDFLRVDTP